MSNLLINLGMVIRKYPDINLVDVLSKGQIESKIWLIDELSEITNNPGLVFLLGGWYGTLAAMMFESKKFDELKIRSFDIDPECADIADTMNRTPYVMEGWQFKASTADMYELNYHQTTYTTRRANGTALELTEVADILINTSCEHLKYFDKWWKLVPENKLCVLQSNNYFDAPDHTNCVESIDEFLEKTNFTKVLFSGELELEKYKRFMIIGEK